MAWYSVPQIGSNEAIVLENRSFQLFGCSFHVQGMTCASPPARLPSEAAQSFRIVTDSPVSKPVSLLVGAEHHEFDSLTSHNEETFVRPNLDGLGQAAGLQRDCREP
jgi:hypothetical protein